MLKKTYISLFFLGLFFFPFNEYIGIATLGEFKTEAGALFLFAGFLLLLCSALKTNKISLPYKNRIVVLMALFLLWCFITTLLNAPAVADSYFKHTSGVNRFLRQYIALLVSSVLFFIFYWNVFIELSLKEILLRIRKTFFYSLIVASVYGFLETGVSFFGIGALYPVLKMFDYFPFLEVSLHAEGRISSISYEPPFFAIYLITIAGWMFSYVLTEKTVFSKYTPLLLVLALTFFSGSRTGLIIVFLQLIVFGAILFREPKFKDSIRTVMFKLLLFSAVLLVFNGPKVIKAVGQKIESLDFFGNIKTNISNKSRLGMQYAAIQVFKEHPLVGVGFGQQTYYARYEYPYWATSNNYEFKVWYRNKNEKAFPPAYNIYTRLLAETGIIGIVLFLSLAYVSISGARKRIRNTEGAEHVLAITVYISLIGLFVNWLQIDTFRIYGLWLSLAILIRFSYLSKKDEHDSTVNTSL
ncbi:O-antigen ligase family protein [Flavobacterium sp. CYK-4]|uniref:O-antigen ligase family protein n=1 Tax=Flavobacterium lotistagni TaxID=2709660 RepID=UPI00140E676D|nr:O-antigen ligase family protein [Flavobacterium lotistagni]NHM07782.1 O-antigen ligase family protein [Flavobacterium lotistagni]